MAPGLGCNKGHPGSRELKPGMASFVPEKIAYLNEPMALASSS